MIAVVTTTSPRVPALIAVGITCVFFGVIFYAFSEKPSIPLAEQHRRAEQIGIYARNRTASEIIAHFGRPQTTQRKFGNCLVNEHVYPWNELSSDGVKWIYMTGYSTCETLTMRNNRCISAERLKCFY